MVHYILRQHRFMVRTIVGCIVMVVLTAFVITRSQYNAGLRNYSSSIVRDINLPLEDGSPPLVLILAYMHTGSSYLGGLFQQHPQTYYMYEPLRSLQNKMVYDKFIKFLNGTEVHISEDVFKQIGEGYVVDIFSCNHSNLDIAALTEKYNQGLRGASMAEYFQCVREHCKAPHDTGDGGSKLFTFRGVCADKGVTYEHQARDAINKCLWKNIIKCKQSKLRAIKMIRMSMDMAGQALQTFPKLRIIHLLRDPRAMLYSNEKRGEFALGRSKARGFLNKYRERSEYICGHMATDFKKAEKLKDIYNGRIFTLRYEDMIEDPMGIAKTVFDFAKVPFTSIDESYVRGKSIDTNHTVSASMWRTHITQEKLNIVEEICDDVFQLLGYNKLENITEVRNLTVSDYKKVINVP